MVRSRRNGLVVGGMLRLAQWWGGGNIEELKKWGILSGRVEPRMEPRGRETAAQPQAEAAAVVTTYYVLEGLYALAMGSAESVEHMFLLQMGLSVWQIFVVGASFTTALVLFEIPTGNPRPPTVVWPHELCSIG